MQVLNAVLLLARFCLGVGGASELTEGGKQRCKPRPQGVEKGVSEQAERLRPAAGAGE